MNAIDRQQLLKKLAQSGQEALRLAAELDEPDLLSAALALGADPDEFGRGAPLFLSGPRCALILLRSGAHPERRSVGKMTPWLKALNEGKWAKAIVLAPRCDKAAVNEKGRDGLMLAIRACDQERLDAGGAPQDGQARAALALALASSPVDFKALDGSTALMISAQSERGVLREELMERARAAGRLNDQDGEGFTALARAVRSKRTGAMEALLTAGADPFLANNEGVTPLMLAARVGALAAIERLGGLGGLDARCLTGLSALEHAMASGGKAVNAVWGVIEQAGPEAALIAAKRAEAWARSSQKEIWIKKAREEWTPRAEQLALSAVSAPAPSRVRSAGL